MKSEHKKELESLGQSISDAETKHKQKLTGCFNFYLKQNPYFPFAILICAVKVFDMLCSMVHLEHLEKVTDNASDKEYENKVISLQMTSKRETDSDRQLAHTEQSELCVFYIVIAVIYIEKSYV